MPTLLNHLSGAWWGMVQSWNLPVYSSGTLISSVRQSVQLSNRVDTLKLWLISRKGLGLSNMLDRSNLDSADYFISQWHEVLVPTLTTASQYSLPLKQTLLSRSWSVWQPDKAGPCHVKNFHGEILHMSKGLLLYGLLPSLVSAFCYEFHRGDWWSQ